MAKQGTMSISRAATVVASGIAVLLAVAWPAHAVCPSDMERTTYTFSPMRKTWILTNLRGTWTEAGLATTYTETITAEVNASMTASVSAEAGIVFAKASAALGVTVGASWMRGGSWTIIGRVVPSGYEGRLVMYHEGRAFTVHSETLMPFDCTYSDRYTAYVIAPLICPECNVWKLQLRPPETRQPAPGPGEDTDDPIYLEIDAEPGDQ